MENSISAKDFAIAAHGNQRYGNGPYVNHLKDVVAVLADFGYKDEWAQAGWLHDVLEDTPTTRSELRTQFGDRVSAMVEACTGVGINRAKRCDSIYAKIALYPDAAVIKMADRIAHIEVAPPISKHFAMYSHEHEKFDKHVAQLAPLAMKRRLDKEINLRRALVQI